MVFDHLLLEHLHLRGIPLLLTMARGFPRARDSVRGWGVLGDVDDAFLERFDIHI